MSRNTEKTKGAAGRPSAPFSKRGSLIVETAIFLPIFIIGVLTVAYLLKVIAVQENVFHAFSDEMRNVAAEAEAIPYPLFFENDVKKRVLDENGDEVEKLRLSELSYRYGLGGETEQIRAALRYDVGVKLPKSVIGSIPVSDVIVCRAFVGARNSGAPMGAEGIEEKKDSVTVWIFPKSGTKYHKEDCTYVANHPKEMALNEGVRKKYGPCKLCKPKDLPNGSLVYCFTASGEAYHRGDCSAVDKYVESIEKDDAEAKGYTACAKCGGE
ncbi:MAG: hypothetical protein LBG71_06815 [Clostridiales Family XIII bacterium]|nr:hypothetical protein [Clostridiales Family XIII bacterium]